MAGVAHYPYQTFQIAESAVFYNPGCDFPGYEYSRVPRVHRQEQALQGRNIMMSKITSGVFCYNARSEKFPLGVFSIIFRATFSIFRTCLRTDMIWGDWHSYQERAGSAFGRTT